MTSISWHTRSRLRIIGAIAAKDIAEAIRNKSIISILIGVAILLLSTRALPLLTRLNDDQRLVVYTENRELLRTLRRYEGLSVSPAASADILSDVVGQNMGSLLGINLDQPLPAGDGPLTFAAYQVHWLSTDDAAAAQAATEAALSEIYDRPVSLELVRAYPPAASGGQPAIAAMTFMMIMLVIGAALVPFLFIEEREGKTLDLLLVSPASVNELVIGKAVAGLVYVFAAGAVLLALYSYLIVQWPVAITVVLLGGLMAVMVGLVFGAFMENQGVLNFVAGLALILMFLPPLVEQFAADRGPAFLANIIHWLPTTAMSRLLRLSMAAETPPSGLAAELLVITGFILALFFLVVWRLRQTDR